MATFGDLLEEAGRLGRCQRFTSAVVQGLSMRSGDNGRDIYIDFLVAGPVELPAAFLILVTTECIGIRRHRRWSLLLDRRLHPSQRTEDVVENHQMKTLLKSDPTNNKDTVWLSLCACVCV